MNYNNLLFFNKSGHQYTFSWNGNFWEGRVLLPQVSTDLFEIEHIFVIEKFLPGIKYGVPHVTPNLESSSLGVTATFSTSSLNVTLDTTVSSDLVGSKLFSYATPDGSVITSISGTTLTLSDLPVLSGSYPINFGAWRSRFEYDYNILDFDQTDNFTCTFIAGNDYLKTSESPTINQGDIIVGDGVPYDSKVISFSNGIIKINKTFTTTGSSVCKVYPVEQYSNVSDRLYQYKLVTDSDLEEPVIVKMEERYFSVDYDQAETIVNNERQTTVVTSSSLSVNIALNSADECNVGRTLVIEDLSQGYAKILLRVEIVGEVIGEDERLKVLLSNIGRSLNAEDAKILRDTDPEEPLIDYEIVNNKRKELLLQASEIFPYMGSYKGLINIIKFFGYQDLRIKEYWLNTKAATPAEISPLTENEKFLSVKKAAPYTQSFLIGNVLQDENHGKYKQVEIYGERSDGTYGIKSSLEQLFPSTTYKKTSLFGLFYDINVLDGDKEDEYGYPVVKNAFMFSPEEVLVKLFALKEKLKKEFLPLNARIIDITGEGFYFQLYKPRAWTDRLTINEINTGLDVEVSATPSIGYIEDLRPFYTRNNTQILLPFVGDVSTTYSISDFGNDVDPVPAQTYSPSQAKKMWEAIPKYYQKLADLGGNFNLGDSDDNGTPYIQFNDKNKHYTPSGFPTVLEITSFNLSWDELQVTWENVDKNISTYNTTLAGSSSLTGWDGTYDIVQGLNYSFDPNSIFGDLLTVPNIPSGLGSKLSPSSGKVQVKFTYDVNNYFLGEVQSYSSGSQEIVIKLLTSKVDDTYSTWDVTLTNLFASPVSNEYYDWGFGADGAYSWDNIRFVGFYEIEWTINKNGANPYNYNFRGELKSYYKLPHVLPYIGEYKVTCRVWDHFNSICIGSFEKMITVQPRNVEFTAVTRFREAEVYTWDQTVRSWDDYDASWVYPSEKLKKKKEPSTLVLSAPTYGNQFQEGETCKVLKEFSAVRATTTLNIGVDKLAVSSITSYPGYSTVLFSTPHGFSSNDSVFISDPSVSNSITGQYTIYNVTSLSFDIPISSVNSPITTGSPYAIGQGSIQIKYKGSNYAQTDFYQSIDLTVDALYYAIQNSGKTPLFGIASMNDITVSGSGVSSWKNMIIEAPLGSGSDYNNQEISVITSGSIYTRDGSSDVQLTTIYFSGGVDRYSDYVDYNPLTDEAPTDNMINWGSKNQIWDNLGDQTWEESYAQTFSSYDLHNDWLGGFRLYNIKNGDRIKVGKDTFGIIIGETNSPPNSYLDLKEVADQMNASSDPGIMKYKYEVRGYSRLESNYNFDGSNISPALPTNVGPKDYESTVNALGFTPTSLHSGKHGDIFIAGPSGKIYRFLEPTNIEEIDTTYAHTTIQVDDNDNIWYYGGDLSVPLVYFDPSNPSEKTAFYSYTNSSPGEFRNIPIPLSFSTAQVDTIALDNLTGNFAMTFYGSPNFLFYDSGRQEFDVFDVSNGFPAVTVRMMVFDYIKDKSKLWMATTGGIVTYDGIRFKTLKIANSGLPSNSIYSICIDEVGHKWIGTNAGIAYYDDERWKVHDTTTNPELTSGIIRNIVNAGYGHIFFVLENGGSYSLGFFNGDNFEMYSNLPGSSNYFNGLSTYSGKYEDVFTFISKIKIIAGDFIQYPGDLVYLNYNGSGYELVHTTYLIPYIHATAKTPGYSGWNFIYHDTSSPLPTYSFSNVFGIGEAIINFNFIVGPIWGDYNLDSGLRRPNIPYVDRYSWTKPEWINYDFDRIIDSHPSINPDHLFLDAPLRDIINGEATREEYWLNSPIERSAARKTNELFADFEWAVSIGGQFDDAGLKTKVDPDGNIYVIGKFAGTISFGKSNNLPASVRTISSNITGILTAGNTGIFIAKYNALGVIQWAKSYAGSTDDDSDWDYLPTSIDTDRYGNVFVSGYRTKNRTNYSAGTGDESNLLIKWDYNGDQSYASQLFTSPTGNIDVNLGVKTDSIGNVFVAGVYGGTLSSGSTTLTATQTTEAFIAKIENGTVIWLKALSPGVLVNALDFVLGGKNDIYITYTFYDGTDQGIKIGRYFSLDLSNEWNVPVLLDNHQLSFDPAIFNLMNPQISVNTNGELLLTTTYDGTLSCQNQSISSRTFGSPEADFGIFKFSISAKLMWIRSAGSAGLADYLNGSKIDKDGNCYTLGSKQGYFTASPYTSGIGNGDSDLILLKHDTDGLLVDVVSIGSTGADSGNGIDLDTNDNIYITGYISGSLDASSWAISPSGLQKDIFIGKIPKRKYITGNSYGSIITLFGTESLSQGDVKTFTDEFEVPVGTPVILNPMDSNIPGKNNYRWKLKDTVSGEVIAQIKDSLYFTWTFRTPGYYTIECVLSDSNGNDYVSLKEGFVRVIDHKKPDAQDLVPTIVNSFDYDVRTIYGNKPVPQLNKNLLQNP